MHRSVIFAVCTLIAITLFVQNASPCKEALCASIISKCLLIDACKCDLINCTCCKDCFQCLGSLYDDCCECIDMCPKSVSTPSNLSTTSHVQDLPEPITELFAALTAEHDPNERWTAYTYTIYRDMTPFLNPAHLQNVEFGSISKDDVSSPPSWAPVNCTVAFMAQCMPWNKCQKSCGSMGASSYRWFHDGCCQCVGVYCLNYGKSESQCLNCPKINGGTVDEEFEAPEDEERPRTHVGTPTGSDTSQEISAEEKSIRKSTETPKLKPAKNSTQKPRLPAEATSLKPSFKAIVTTKSV